MFLLPGKEALNSQEIRGNNITFGNQFFPMFRQLYSFFLLAALLLSSSLFIFPLISYLPETGAPIAFSITGFQNYEELPASFRNNFWSLPFLGVVVVFLLVLILIVWNKRNLQLRLAVFTAVLLLGLEGMIFFFIFQIPHVLKYTHRTFHAGILFPIVSFLLLIMAIQGIRKAELRELARNHFSSARKS